ncbi:MAG: hypothetical protein ABI793_06535 [Flavobacterium sp.]
MSKLTIILLLLLISCIKTVDGDLSKEELIDLKQNIFYHGDKYSFSRLIAYYSDRDNYYELLPYSFIMADKYKNGDGYFQVYYDLIKINNNGRYATNLIVNLNQDNIEFVLSNLEKGAKLNDTDCKVFLAKHYKNGFGIIKNEKIADSLMNSIEYN